MVVPINNPQIDTKTPATNGFQEAVLFRAITAEDCKHSINSKIDTAPFLALKKGDVIYFNRADPTNYYFDNPQTRFGSIRLQPKKDSPSLLIPKNLFTLKTSQK